LVPIHSGIDTNGNLSSDARRTLSWSSFDMPTQISQGSITANFVYGPEHQRTRQTRSDGSVVIYAGAQEVETKSGQITVKTYWPYGAGVEIDRPLATATEFNWIHTDRLGSPVALSSEDGTLREKLAYDAWGKRRTLDGVAINGTATPDSIVGQIDNRGFTGHEMLDQLELVHMNGRIYDPLTARFMSADPLIQDPMNGQSYNRYSYVLNNPTNLTDPTGFSPLDEAMANRWAQRMGAAIADLSGDVKDKAIEMVNQMVNGDGRAAVNQEGNKQNGNGAVLLGGVGKDNSKMGGATVVGAVGDAANWVVEKTGLQDAGNAVGSAYNAMQAYFYGDATNGGTQATMAGEQAQAAGDKALSAALMVSPVGPEALAGAVVAGSIKIVGQAAIKVVPKVVDSKLTNIVNDLYKGARGPNPIGTGSTADAIRNEAVTDLATGGRFHTQKGTEYIRALENWQAKNPNASHYDKMVAESLKNDLRNALGK